MASRRSQSPWRRAVVRSRSLPRIFRSSSNDDGDNKPSKRGGVSAWAPVVAIDWLLTPQLSRKNKNEKNDGFHRRPLFRRTPFLTLLLIRLDDNMQSYCEHLADPTIKRAAAASAVLEATVVTSSSPSPSSSSPNTPPSPASPRGSASAMALEGEWEKYVSPLMLLTGAEVVFAQMEHVFEDEPHKNSKKLLSLYQKIEDDLMIVKETLCHPFLGEAPQETPSASAQSEMSTHIMSNKAASTLAVTLDALMVVTSIRRELLGLHDDMFLADPKEKDLLELSVRCRSLLKDLPESNSEHCGAALVVIQSIVFEIKATSAALAAAYHLQRCCFLDTVLNAKVLKVHMRVTPSTTLQMWFRRTLEKLLSVMSIFFDRIDAYATPLYGFDKSHMQLGLPDTTKRSRSNSESPSDDRLERLGLVRDYEFAVLDFLRRHQSKGGSPMAVTVVLDAVLASCFHVGRGFESKQGHEETPSEEWPAVYMRTTIHSGSNNSSTLSSGVRGKLGIASSAFRPSQRLLKSSSRRDVPTGDEPGLRLSWSSDGGTNKRKQKESQLTVLEYPPESGRPSWPHLEWETLVPNLVKTKNSPFGEGETYVDHSNDVSGFSEGGIQLFRPSKPTSLENTLVTDGSNTNDNTSVSASTRSPLSIPWVADPAPGKQIGSPPALKRPSASSSVHHLTQLNEYMWLVVMVKEEESRWNLRRSRGCSDEDIHSFMHDMSSKLGVEGLFRAKNVQDASEKVKPSVRETRGISLSKFSSDHDWRDIESHRFLGSLKETFGLRPQSPMRSALKSPYQIGYFNRRERGLYTAESTQSSSSYSGDDLDSAVAFFFGPELTSILQSSTNPLALSGFESP